MGKRKRCIGNRLDRQNILQILSKIINQILTDISNSLSYFNTKEVDLGLHILAEFDNEDWVNTIG